ncbi:cytochrome P460 family protein [Pontibacterium granulatum]|uniref:cytochrome P460 family protein n=1 Tax=Pontibacterium granulatum TaxID=2036029 RepID=UPI00249BC8BD|nr:cytochrome P460 family protein [Pontibacterium granulatum]MDI3324050.1 cytochrome P460 family protein [Pontibacterium granulatum]
MTKPLTRLGTAGIICLLIAGCDTMVYQEPKDDMPFGGPSSTDYAADLWSAMAAAGLVGKGAITGTPYTGQPPHGAILDTLDTTLQMGSHNGVLIVKRNFGGEGVSKQSVANNPDKYLKAVTVMYKRESGYDPDNQNWFWVKYKADGSLDTNPAGMKLAGRVAKGKQKGCIACHQAAPGGDMVFNHDRYKQ